MLFLLSKLFWGLLRPSGLLVLLAVAGGIWRRGWGRLALWLGLGGLLAVLLLPLDQWLLRPLEERFPRPGPPAHVDGIIVLGGVVDGLLLPDRGMPALNAQAERLTELLILARRYPEARLAFTGGDGSPFPGSVPEAEPVRTLLSELGLPPERVTFEGASRTTWENAVLSRELLHPQPGETWLLVTSASHMPRAVGTFRAEGWPVLAWPVAYKTTHEIRAMTLTDSIGARLSGIDWALHEWVGMLAYWLLGHGSALFPAPAGG
jgi:uncharacterized SAM-binding protein YcdF (DUF218 family)